MAGNFKIFISYRRKGGYDIAKLVYDRLRLDGYSVFFDIDTLRSGSFDKELEKRVKKCKDFILILSSGIFDRLSKKGYDENEDWVRQEINSALQANKNIIPLVQDDFAFPEVLPADIKDISRKNSLELSPKHFEATYERMKESFLLSKPRWTVRHKKHIKNFFIITILAFIAYLSVMAYNYHQKEVETIKAAAEQNLVRITDSIKTLTDSIRITNELEKKRLIDSISRAILDSIDKNSLVPEETVNTPAKIAPEEIAPKETASVKTMPTKSAPAKSAPTKSTSAKTAPAKSTSTKSASAKTTPQKTSKKTPRSTK
jgi:hypothetical protein